MRISTTNYLEIVTDLQTEAMPSKWNNHIEYLWKSLRFTLIISKGQGKIHAHFHCE